MSWVGCVRVEVLPGGARGLAARRYRASHGTGRAAGTRSLENAEMLHGNQPGADGRGPHETMTTGSSSTRLLRSALVFPRRDAARRATYM